MNTLVLIKLVLSHCRLAPFKSTRLWHACLHMFSSSHLEGFGGRKCGHVICHLQYYYNFVFTVRNTKSNARMGPPNPKRRMGRSLCAAPISWWLSVLRLAYPRRNSPTVVEFFQKIDACVETCRDRRLSAAVPFRHQYQVLSFCCYAQRPPNCSILALQIVFAPSYTIAS